MPLRGGDRAVSGDLLKVMDRYACVGHPRQAGVPQVVAFQVVEPSLVVRVLINRAGWRPASRRCG